MEKRLNKYLSETGYCSRREADRLIAKNIVHVNGVVATVGTKVQSSDIVSVDGVIINNDVSHVYIALNKPVGITSTTDKSDPSNIVDFMNYKDRIFHVGRLDKDSEGLIFMTNDGDIVNKILRSGNKHDKEYVVTVDKSIDDVFLNGLRNGVPILNTVTKPCIVKRLSRTTFKIILTEGLNRQVRRMCSYYDYQVLKLKRTRIMNISLDVALGTWRHFTESEVKRLKQLVATSSKTEEASK